MANQSDAYKFQEQVDRLADLVGADVPRDRLKVAVEEIAQTVDVDTSGLATESTLSSTLSREIAAWSAGTLPVEQQTPIEVGTWSAGTLAVEQQTPIEVGTWNAGTLAVEQQTPLALEADDGTGTVTAIERDGTALLVQHDGVLDVSSRDGRNLGDVDITALPDSDVVEHDGTTLAGGTSETFVLAAEGVENLRATVVSSGSYDVTISWQTSAGTEVSTTDVVSGQAGGTPTDIDQPALTPYAVVNVTDTSGADQTLNGVAHLA